MALDYVLELATRDSPAALCARVAPAPSTRLDGATVHASVDGITLALWPTDDEDRADTHETHGIEATVTVQLRMAPDRFERDLPVLRRVLERLLAGGGDAVLSYEGETLVLRRRGDEAVIAARWAKQVGELATILGPPWRIGDLAE